jgi:metal-dependent amidase/aminoacylase/carboxypeptidase family protein
MTALEPCPTAESIREQVIDWRRYLQQHPELSFHEERTSQFIVVGTTHNVIAGSVEMEGTIRTFDTALGPDVFVAAARDFFGPRNQ